MQPANSRFHYTLCIVKKILKTWLGRFVVCF